MAEGILSKLRTITLGNLHELLDATINLNSMAAVKQHVRDLETASEQIDRSAAVAKGRVTQAQTEIAHVKEGIAKDNGKIDLILGDGDDSNDDLAIPIQKRVTAAEANLEDMNANLVTLQKTATALGQASAKLHAKTEEMIKQCKRLQDMERTTAAQEQAAGALKAANSAVASGSKASIDSVEQKIKDRAAEAGAVFDQQLAEATSSDDGAVEDIAAKQALAARKARLAAGKTGGATG